MDEKRETELKKRVRPILKEGKPGDWEHTLRAWPEIVIPALFYLHDIGWSRVDLDD